MSKPIEEMSLEEIQAERVKIAEERAALELHKTHRQQSDEMLDRHISEIRDVPGLTVVPDDPFADPEPEEAEEEAPKPAPWPHQHLVHSGLELEVRIPNQSALMAISMLNQLNGQGELQMDIFNTFLGNHLSPTSLAKVIKEFTRPETEMTVQSLVQALVNLRVEQAKGE